MALTNVAPPFDPTVQVAVDAFRAQMPTITPDLIPLLRSSSGDPTLGELVEELGIEKSDHLIPGFGGAQIEVSVYRPGRRLQSGAAVYHIHGGGMFMGDRTLGIRMFLPLVATLGTTVVTVEYRLAPEFPDPVPVEDSYSGLVWMSSHAAELGIDQSRIVVAGGSAGGGLAAGVTLLARDRTAPHIAGQMLMCPMLDDRNETVSSRQIDGIGIWDRSDNLMGWTALLGERRASEDVSVYAAPGRCEDLSGLPPTFIDVGSAETFRDEDVAYATRIWAAGGVAELHVWPGGCHGFASFAPTARISEMAIHAQNSWLSQLLAGQLGDVQNDEN